MPVNIVDLGLIYDIVLSPASADSSDVTVKMTLTSPGCPMANAISHEVQRKVQALRGVSSTHVELVWEPAWRPDRITLEGRRQLNITS